MSITINTNISSLQANRELNKQASELTKHFDKLSSGLRIARASDDPAGLAIAMDLLANADTGAVASRNISDGVSLTSIADGALESATDITDRMSELAAQAANGTLSDQQRGALNNEYQQLQSELDRIAGSTEFNGVKLLEENSTVSIQAGTDSSSNSQMMLSLPSVSSSNLGLPTSIATQNSAQQALEGISAARDTLTSARGAIGAVTSRLETAFENVKTQELGQREAASRIRDADVAQESSGLVASRIREQISGAISAQTNQTPSLALQLLG